MIYIIITAWILLGLLTIYLLGITDKLYGRKSEPDAHYHFVMFIYAPMSIFVPVLLILGKIPIKNPLFKIKKLFTWLYEKGYGK